MPSAPILIRPGKDGRLIVQFPYSPDHVVKIKTMECLRLRVQDIDFSRNRFSSATAAMIYTHVLHGGPGSPQPSG